MKESIASISPDKRIQVLLIGFSFNAFLEGAAGFWSTCSYLPLQFLVGLGFNPISAAAICLVSNIAGGAYGAMGIPVTVPAALTELSPVKSWSKYSCNTMSNNYSSYIFNCIYG